jgi:hypothetical protein
VIGSEKVEVHCSREGEVGGYDAEEELEVGPNGCDTVGIREIGRLNPEGGGVCNAEAGSTG